MKAFHRKTVRYVQTFFCRYEQADCESHFYGICGENTKDDVESEYILLFFIIFATPVVTWSQFEFIANLVYSILTWIKYNTRTNQQTSLII